MEAPDLISGPSLSPMMFLCSPGLHWLPMLPNVTMSRLEDSAITHNSALRLERRGVTRSHLALESRTPDSQPVDL